MSAIYIFFMLSGILPAGFGILFFKWFLNIKNNGIETSAYVVRETLKNGLSAITQNKEIKLKQTILLEAAL